MIVQFWETVVEVVTGFTNALVNAFSNMTELFYESETGFTVVGQLLLIGLGMSIVYFAFRFIRSLIRK